MILLSDSNIHFVIIIVMLGPSGGQMRDDRRASHDPARGGVVGGGALIARRPAYKPSTAGGENTAPIALGEHPNPIYFMNQSCTPSILKLCNCKLITSVLFEFNFKLFIFEHLYNARLLFYLIFQFFSNDVGDNFEAGIFMR